MRPLLLSVLAALAPQVHSLGFFSEPGLNGPTGDFTENKIYKIGDTMHIKWETDYTSGTDLVIWQQWPADPTNEAGKNVPLQKNSPNTNYDWTVSIDSFPTVKDTVRNGGAAVFYIMVYESHDQFPIIATSHYFNVTKGDDDVQDSSSTSATTPAGPTSTTASETATHANHATETSGSKQTSDPTGSPSTSPTPPASSSKGLSTGATAGIAVGATIGGVLVLGVAGLLLWRRLRNGKAASSSAELPAQEAEVKGPTHQGQTYEVPGTEVHKLPGEEAPRYGSPPAGHFAPSQQLHQQTKGPPGLYEAP